ncbi:MAG: hypothetical protein ACLFVK_05330 [Dehalococcoidia bacterium]
METLESILTRLSGSEELVPQIVSVLSRAARTGTISYEEVENIDENAEDILLLANQWRLLVPWRTWRSGEWDDSVLMPAPGEMYAMPNIVRELVENAEQTGNCDLDSALERLFQRAKEPGWERIPELVHRLTQESRDFTVSVAQIKRICSELGLGDRVDSLISELKGSGVMSPKLGALAKVAEAGSPVYELNRLVFEMAKIKEDNLS